MLRDVTITKVRALVFDLVNFKGIEGDLARVSKMYNLDHYHLLNMRDLGLLYYDKATNYTRSKMNRVNVEEITSLVIARYIETRKERKRKPTSQRIIKEHYYSPPLNYSKPKQDIIAAQAPEVIKDSILTRFKKLIYAIFRK